MRELLLGITAVLGACTVWSLSLLAPELLGVGALTVIAARYPGGGLPSLAMLRRSRGQIDWARAMRFSVFGQVGNYALALIAVRLAGAALVVGIVGLTPVVMAVAERRLEGRPLRPLMLPLAGSIAGLATLSTQQMAAPPVTSSRAMVATGVILTVISVGMWTWATIDNGRYLRSHPELSTARWASATSVTSMMLAAPVTLYVLSRMPLAAVSPALVVAVTVGVGGSWLAVMAFGHGIRLLPAGLAGQLLVVETVLGLGILAIVRHEMPTPMSFLAVGVLLVSVLLAVRVHASSPGQAARIAARSARVAHHIA